MEEFIFVKTHDGFYSCGLGPFRESAILDEKKPGFYLNNFALSDPCPWKYPQNFHKIRSLKEIFTSKKGQIDITWSPPHRSSYEKIFHEIHSQIMRGEFDKGVLYHAQLGELKKGSLLSLFDYYEDVPPSLWGYGYSFGGRVVFGMTPEVFFSFQGKKIETVALAGTTSADVENTFRKDPKEIDEHQYVTNYLLEHFRDMGRARSSKRHILRTGDMRHFQTRLSVEIEKPINIDSLITRLHPTPALGVFPKNGEFLQRLLTWRLQAQVPKYFGAPLGVSHAGSFHSLVTIRNLIEEDGKVWLSSGCGLVKGSQLENEWEELRLKRQFVKKIFHV